jgi:Phosphatidylethanolamine-binding protein
MKGTYFGYDGPAPPWTDSVVHHYTFTLYAIDVPKLEVKGDLTGANVREAINGHRQLNGDRCSISAGKQSGIHGELRKESRDGGLVPEVKRLREQPPMAGCGVEMSAQAKGSVDRLEHTEKTLSVLWRLKALHLPFSHADWLMRVLGSVVQITALPVFHVWQNQLLRCSIAP